MSFFFSKISLSQSQKSWESLLNYLQYLQARRIMDVYPLSRKRKLFIVNSGSLSFLNCTEIKFSITDIQNFNFTHEMYKFIICNLHYVCLLIHFCHDRYFQSAWEVTKRCKQSLLKQIHQ